MISRVPVPEIGCLLSFARYPELPSQVIPANVGIQLFNVDVCPPLSQGHFGRPFHCSGLRPRETIP